MDRRNFFKSIALGSAGVIMVPDYASGWEKAGEGEPDELKSLFFNPPSSYGPWVIWEWLNGNVTREGITLDLEFMKKVGISGAVCACSGSEVPAGTVVYGSEEWLDYTAHAITETARLGLQLMLHVKPQDAFPCGSPVTVDAGLRKLVWTEMQITGNMPARLKLPQPPSGMEHYRDAFVLAFPSADEESNLIPGNQAIDPESVIDLTSFLNKKGVLKWKPTAGQSWTLLRIGHTIAGSSPSGNGESSGIRGIDIFRKEAVEACFGKFINSINERLNPEATESFAGLTTETPKPEILNWSADFDTEFEKRRKYSLVPWLPALTGKIAGSREKSEKFLQDFRQTQSELINENYVDPMGKLCQSLGLSFHVITPVGADQAEESRKPYKDEYFTVFPAPPAWSGKPSLLKPQADRYFTLGSDRLLLQGFVHQPYSSGWPGMTMAPFGSLFDRNNTWSPLASGFFETIRRTQFLLQKVRAGVDPDNFRENELNPPDPDFVYRPENPDAVIRFIHKALEETQFWFICNQQSRLEKIYCSFRIEDRQPEIWNPETGEIAPVPLFEARDGRLFMPLDLLPDGAVFVIFRKRSTPDTTLVKQISQDGRLLMGSSYLKFTNPELPEPADSSPEMMPALSFRTRQDGLPAALFLQNGIYDLILNNEYREESARIYIEGCMSIPLPGYWTIQFPEGSGAPADMDWPELISLSRHEDFNIRHFSGTCRYKTIFYLTDSDFSDGRQFLIDLGQVEVVARVLINGIDAGVVWKKPYVADISAGAKKGENLLEVEVSTCWFNRLVGDESLPEENEYNAEGYIRQLPEWYINNQPKPGKRVAFSTWKKVGKNDLLLESGLLGPVKLILGEEMLI